MNREELAWAAGFFDGEGTFATAPDRQRRGNVSPRVSLPQLHREPLDRFAAAVGVDCRFHVDTSHGVDHPIWKLQIGSHERVQAVIAMLWPFLCEPKRAQAEKVLRAMNAYYSEPRQWKGRAKPPCPCGRPSLYKGLCDPCWRKRWEASRPDEWKHRRAEQRRAAQARYRAKKRAEKAASC